MVSSPAHFDYLFTTVSLLLKNDQNERGKCKLSVLIYNLLEIDLTPKGLLALVLVTP